jgi:hypothetical protein
MQKALGFIPSTKIKQNKKATNPKPKQTNKQKPTINNSNKKSFFSII